MRIRIGYAYLDRLLSYPDVRYLSGCSLPIRMLLTYPDVAYLSGCSLPIRVCDGIRGASAPFPPDAAAFRLVAQWCYTT